MRCGLKGPRTASVPLPGSVLGLPGFQVACGERDFKDLRKSVEVTPGVRCGRLGSLQRFAASEEGFSRATDIFGALGRLDPPLPSGGLSDVPTRSPKALCKAQTQKGPEGKL